MIIIVGIDVLAILIGNDYQQNSSSESTFAPCLLFVDFL